MNNTNITNQVTLNLTNITEVTNITGINLLSNPFEKSTQGKKK
jgi:hypothetical protein